MKRTDEHLGLGLFLIVPWAGASSIPTLSLSVHSSECLSNNTDRTIFSLVSIRLLTKFQ